MPVQTAPAPFTLRPAVPGDGALLADLGARLFRQAYGTTHPEPHLTPYLQRAFDADGIDQALIRPGTRIFLAGDGAKTAIGYAHLRRSDPPFPEHLPGHQPAEVLRFYVEAGWHGRGVGAAMMRACAAAACDLGADVLWVDAWTGAPGAIAFYQRMGMQVTGTAHFAFGDRLDDDVILARRLP